MSELKDALTKSFDQVTETEPTIKDAPPVPPQTLTSEPKEPVEPVQEKPITKETKSSKVEEPIDDTPKRKYPAGWNSEEIKNFDKLPPEQQKALIRREEQRNNEVFKVQEEGRKLKSEFEPIRDVLSPYMEQWRLSGVTPSVAIQQLLAVRDLIANNPLEAVKFIAKTHGVNPSQLVQTASQQTEEIPPHLREIQTKYNQLEQYIIQRERAEFDAKVMERRSEIDKFADAHPNFELVQERILQLIQSGSYDTLEKAYRAAISEDENLYNQELARIQKEQMMSQQSKVEKGRAASFNLKSKTVAPTVQPKKFDNWKDAIRDAADKAGL